MLFGQRKLALQALLAGVAVGLVVRGLRKRKATGAPVACSSAGPSGGTLEGFKYIETIRGGGSPDQPMPMLVVFHSRGATPQGAASFPGLNGPVRVIRPAGPIPTNSGGHSWYSSPIKTNPEGLAPELSALSSDLQHFIAALMRCRPTTGMPVVTGSSQGGVLSYLLASAAPGLVSGSVAVLGYLPPSLWNYRMAPTVGLHNSGDNTVPYPATQQYWSTMQASGASLTTKTFEGGHQVGGQMGSAWRSAVQDLLDQQR